MIKRWDIEYEFEDNDASYAAFGWDFQINAGIYLFLDNIVVAKEVAVESKYQDIEMILDDRTVYAQAKALQDENTKNTENAKLRDALVSLAKVKVKENDLLIYISNLKAPIDGEKDRFRNEVVYFSECDEEQQKFIRAQVATIIDKLEQVNERGDTNAKQKEKNEILIKRLKNFKYDNLLISSIYPFTQTKERYKIIEERLMRVLVDTMGLNTYVASGIQRRILEHWQSVLTFNATVKDAPDRKFINKKDFVWTVIAALGDKITSSFIVQSLSEAIDSSIEEDCQRYLESVENLYHERFEFMNSVLQRYEGFKKLVPKGEMADEAFIKSDEWKSFSMEFADIKSNILREYVTKCYMYKMINKNRDFLNISNGVNL